MQENTPIPVVTQPEEQGLEIDIVQLVDSWRKHISVIVLLAVIGGMIGYAYTLLFIVPKYRASATMYVISASANSVFDVSDLNLGSNLTADYIQLVQSRTMLERVIEDTGDPLTVSQLKKMISVTNNTSSRIITFTVSSKSPQQAMRLANSFVKQSIIYLPQMMGVKDNPPTEIDLALLPSSPYNMNYVRNMLIGVLAGTLIAMGIYTLIEIMTDTFNSSDDVEKVLGFVPVAVVPENNQHHGGKYSKYGSYGKYYYYYYTDNDKKKKSKSKSSKSSSDRRSK